MRLIDIIKTPLIIFLLIIFLSTIGSLNSNEAAIEIKIESNRKYVSLYDIVKLTDTKFVYDVITKRGKFYRYSHNAIFQNDYQFIIVDGTIIKDLYPIKRINSEVLFPFNMAYEMLEQFYPEYKLNINNNRIVFNKKDNIIHKLPDKQETIKTDHLTKSKDRITFIVIDPGHGGKDPGAIGKDKTREKWITLKIARLVHGQLKKKLKNVRIKMTRNSDKFISLGDRTETANKLLKKHDNGLFISIHVNASISPRTTGFETYYLSQNPSNDSARTTAALENNVVVYEKNSKKRYDEVDYIEAIMLTTQIQKESKSLAGLIQKEIKIHNRIFPSRGVKKADFFVLRGSLMPAVLVEVGYVTNKKELRYLKQRDHQEKLASSISEGIVKFIKRYYKTIK